MSDGIISTPAQAQRISAMPVINDLTQRKSIRIPVSTPEQGLEAIELKDVLEEVVSKLIDTIMPIGYIYVQYPGQPAPQSLYPKSTWSDISASFAGNFFRVAGGLASNFNSGSQLESVPEISASWVSKGGGQANTSRYSGAVANLSTSSADTASETNSKLGYAPTWWFDASRSHGAYGRRDEVAPKNQTMRIWRKTGTVVATKSVAVLDEHHLFVKVVELEEDEAGLIGFNPCVHVELPSPTMLHAQASQKTTYEEAHVLWYDIKHNVWQWVRDDRGRMIWHADGSSRKNWEVVAKLGAEETFEAPVLEESQLDELDDEQ